MRTGGPRRTSRNTWSGSSSSSNRISMRIRDGREGSRVGVSRTVSRERSRKYIEIRVSALLRVVSPCRLRAETETTIKKMLYIIM